ncbi:hypothetical protein JB92DRAFT_3133299 [Gautieria morchelliformis]|nr:hypothetical protein JB92DRAFT_3133299 [Gautieria morchelliformis]
MDSLALELLDEIIGHVDEKDDISRFHLLACSLVCRSWLPSSQRRLFHHINLMSTPVQPAMLRAHIQRLNQLLLNSPHLIRYIRVLELPDLSLPFSAYTHPHPHPCTPGWIAIDYTLSPLLPKLTHVQELKISGLAWEFLLLEDARELLGQVLLELLSMAFVRITSALFTPMDDFTNFINRARGLTGLSLNLIDMSWLPRPPLETNQGEDSKQRFENRIHLTSLDMRNGYENSAFISWSLGPRSHLGVSHVHTLHIALPSHSNTSLLSSHLPVSDHLFD